MEKPIEENEGTINYKISKIQVLEYHFIEVTEEIKNELPKNLMIRSKFQSGMDENREVFGILLDYGFLHKLPDGQYSELAGIQVSTEFHIKEMKSALKLTDDKYTVDDRLLSVLVSVAYSNTRGLMFAKSEGTYINRFYLPILKINDLLEKFKKDTNMVVTPNVIEEGTKKDKKKNN